MVSLPRKSKDEKHLACLCRLWYSGAQAKGTRWLVSTADSSVCISMLQLARWPQMQTTPELHSGSCLVCMSNFRLLLLLMQTPQECELIQFDQTSDAAQFLPRWPSNTRLWPVSSAIMLVHAKVKNSVAYLLQPCPPAVHERSHRLWISSHGLETCAAQPCSHLQVQLSPGS